MSWYRTRVERDLTRWQSAGWVSDAGATAIRAELAAAKAPIGAAGVLAILGAVLFGFAAMSFVAANWNDMSKLARLVLLVGALWAFYGGAAYLFARQLAVFANAAVLGGIAVYGASIMLIAQMYHMEGNPPDAVLMWALGALLAAVLLRSNAALAAAFVLLAVWTGMERGINETAHWLFLLPWAATAAVAAWLAWPPACISPRLASQAGSRRSATSSLTGMRIGSSPRSAWRQRWRPLLPAPPSTAGCAHRTQSSPTPSLWPSRPSLHGSSSTTA
jgi:uncharacterized membrane protein